MYLMVGIRSAWKCVEVSLQDGSVPVIGGVALPKCNIEPALWFKALVLDCVCIDCSEYIISWTVASPSPPLQHSPPPHTLMAPQEEGHTVCHDNLHSLFELAETLFRVSPLCSPTHHPPPPPPHRDQESWEQQCWLRLLHTLLLPLLTLQRGDLPSLQHTLTHHCSHTISALDASIAQTSTTTLQLKQELQAVCAELLPLVISMSTTRPCPPNLLSYLTSDLREMEDEARSKIACCVQSLALPLTGSSDPALSPARLETEKREAQDNLMNLLQLRAVLDTLDCSPRDSECSATAASATDEEMSGHIERYLELHSKLGQARTTESDLSRKKILALSVREAMEQAVASLQAGHVTAGMDTDVLGGHSTDVLREALQYKAKQDFSTLNEKMKHVLDMNHGRASQLHKVLFHAVERDWFPKMCDDFVVVSQDMAKQSSLFRRRLRGWQWRFSVRSRAQSSPAQPIPTSMAQAGQLLHSHFQEIVTAVCEYFSDHDSGFQQQVWLCYEKLFFNNFFTRFLTQYQSENLKFCEQLRINALSVGILPPSSLALHLPQTSWLSLFSPRSFEDAVDLYTVQQDAAWHSEPPVLSPALKTYFGSVVDDLYCMAKSQAPLEKLQLLTSAFRKTMATLSDLKLNTLLKDGSTDFQLAGVSCDDLLPLLVLLLLQLPPVFLSHLWLHCLLLEDTCPTFLQAGWHGYSLTTFRSTLQVISEL